MGATGTKNLLLLKLNSSISYLLAAKPTKPTAICSPPYHVTNVTAQRNPPTNQFPRTQVLKCFAYRVEGTQGWGIGHIGTTCICQPTTFLFLIPSSIVNKFKDMSIFRGYSNIFEGLVINENAKPLVRTHRRCLCANHIFVTILYKEQMKWSHFGSMESQKGSTGCHAHQARETPVTQAYFYWLRTFESRNIFYLLLCMLYCNLIGLLD